MHFLSFQNVSLSKGCIRITALSSVERKGASGLLTLGWRFFGSLSHSSSHVWPSAWPQPSPAFLHPPSAGTEIMEKNHTHTQYKLNHLKTKTKRESYRIIKAGNCTIVVSTQSLKIGIVYN